MTCVITYGTASTSPFSDKSRPRVADDMDGTFTSVKASCSGFINDAQVVDKKPTDFPDNSRPCVADDMDGASTPVEPFYPDFTRDVQVTDKKPTDFCKKRWPASVLVQQLSAQGEMSQSSQSAVKLFINALLGFDKRPTDFCKERRPASVLVQQLSAQGEMSQSSQSASESLVTDPSMILRRLLNFAIKWQDDKAIQALSKKLIDETSAHGNASKNSSNAVKSNGSLRKQYRDYVALLRMALPQRSNEAVQEILKRCAPTLDEQRKRELSSAEQFLDEQRKRELSSAEWFRCTLEHYSKEVIQALLKICAHVFGEQKNYSVIGSELFLRILAQYLNKIFQVPIKTYAPELDAYDYLIEAAHNTVETNDLSIEELKVLYLEKLQSLSVALRGRSADNQDIKSLIKECANVLDAYDAVSKDGQNIDPSTDPLIDQYSKNLMLVQATISQNNPEMTQAMLNLCEFEFNNLTERPQNLEELAATLEEQYENNVALFDFVSSSGYHTALPLVLEISTDSQERNLLHFFAAAGELDRVEILLESGAEIDAEIDALDVFGYAPLHYAAQFGRLGTAKLLVKHGANMHLTTLSGKTPYSLAQEIGYGRTAEFLQDKMNEEQQKLAVMQIKDAEQQELAVIKKPKLQGFQAYVENLHAYTPEWLGYICRA